jgi:soluble lytic murein transglycosylase-like protein
MIRASLTSVLLATTAPALADCGDHVSAAAAWSGLPASWVAAVMQAESSARPRAVSSAGAMGCMQLMPGTWAEITRQYSLGTDPYHVRANMFAGAAYLRALVDRFGWPTALAGYHAGPARAQAFLTGRPLPADTSAYIARVVALSTQRRVSPPRNGLPFGPSPHPLFAVRGVPAAAPQGQQGTQ